MTDETIMAINAALTSARVKHPDLGRDPLSVLVEEVGEIARAQNEGDPAAMIRKIDDAIAVLIRWREGN